MQRTGEDLYGDAKRAKFGEDYSDEVEAYIVTNSLDERAGQALRTAGPRVQRAVMDRGHLQEARNPSGALMGRLRDAQACGAAAGPIFGGISGEDLTKEVQEFIAHHGLDERATEALTSAAPEIQRAVVSRGNLADARSPSAAVMGRLRDAQSSGGGDASWGGAGESVSRDAVEAFVAESNLDERASTALLEATPSHQSQVLARGSVSDARNPSAAVLGRLRDAAIADQNSGWGGGWDMSMCKGMMGKGWGGGWGGGCGWGGKGMGMGMGMGKGKGKGMSGCGASGGGPDFGGDIETFIAESNLDERATKALRESSKGSQQEVMARGAVTAARNPSAALLGRLRDIAAESTSGWGKMGGWSMGGWGKGGGWW